MCATPPRWLCRHGGGGARRPRPVGCLPGRARVAAQADVLITMLPGQREYMNGQGSPRARSGRDGHPGARHWLSGLRRLQHEAQPTGVAVADSEMFQPMGCPGPLLASAARQLIGQRPGGRARRDSCGHGLQQPTPNAPGSSKRYRPDTVLCRGASCRVSRRKTGPVSRPGDHTGSKTDPSRPEGEGPADRARPAQPQPGCDSPISSTVTAARAYRSTQHAGGGGGK